MATRANNWLAASAVLAIGCGTESIVLAQATPTETPASNPADSTSLEEITVTAEKRTENLQKAPVAVDTVSNEALIRGGAERLDNIEKVMPDVKIAVQGAAETISIRGVYSTDNSPTAEQANAVHIDGAYIAKSTAINGLLFDVQRVEVAKGPQGTLYGRNANGGTVNIITNKPDIGQDEADVSVEYGSYNYLRASGAAGVTLSDTTAVRAAFQTISHKGYMASGLDDQDEKSGRLSFLFKPDDSQSLLLTGDIVRRDPMGSGLNVVGSQPANALNPAHYYIPSDPRNDTFYTTPIDAAGNTAPTGTSRIYSIHSNNAGLTAVYDYDFGWAAWTTEANYRKLNQIAYDLNNLGQGSNLNPPVTGYPGGEYNYNPQNFTSESIESRLTSTAATPLQWVAGLYGFKDKDSGTMIGYGNLLTVVPSIQIANGQEVAKSFAGFGQVVFTPPALDALHVTVGGRYTHDHKDASGIFTQFGTSTAPGFLTTVPEAERSWSAGTYRVGLSYDLTDKNLIYADTATGFKSGGFAYGPGTNPTGGPEYAPEKIKAYEVGSKNRFFNDSLQVNLEAWYYKYKDYQTNVVLYGIDQIPLPVLTATTAGTATYKGATIDLEYQLTPLDLIRIDWTALSARYNNFVVPTPPGYSNNPCPTGCVPGAILENFSNTDIPAVPHMSGTATYDHTIRLPHGSLDGQVAAFFHGNTLLDLEQDAIYGQVHFEEHSFWTSDASVRYESESSRWNVIAYVHNISDGLHYRTGAYSTQTHLFTATLYDPRVVGVSFAMKFKP